MYARISALLLTVALASVATVAAQERFGEVTGKVSDQQGLALPGVSVTVTNNQNQRSSVAVTGPGGP